jgi:hypothetical protein
MMTEGWQNPGNDTPILAVIPPNTHGNPSPVAVPASLTAEIMLVDSHLPEFDYVWDRVKLFMHTSFGNTIKNGYVCEVNESYHKLVKKISLAI